MGSQSLDNGPISLQWYIDQEGHTPPSMSTIRRILTEAGLIVAQPKKRPKSSLVPFEAAQPNETWQADVSNWHMPDGRRIDILDWLDDHSRLLSGISCHESVTAQIVVNQFSRLAAPYGTPFSTLTGNGQVFTSRFKGGKNAFEYLLIEHGIRQKNGSPGHPQTQGKIEQFHQTLKNWLRKKPPAHTLEQLQRQLDEFEEIYNDHRPHRSLDRRTPQQAYQAGIKASPTTPPANQPWRIRHDRIDHTGKVSLRRAGKMHHLGIGRKHSGQPVILLIDENHVTITHEQTGEVLGQHAIESRKGYWKNQLN